MERASRRVAAIRVSLRNLQRAIARKRAMLRNPDGAGHGHEHDDVILQPQLDGVIFLLTSGGKPVDFI
jgi:hypothetical protein